MRVEELIKSAQLRRASDIHFEEGKPIALRVDGKIKVTQDMGTPDLRDDIVSKIPKAQQQPFSLGEDADFAIQTEDGIRCRVNVFRKMDKVGCVMRILSDRIPSMDELGLPPLLKQLALLPRGLVLVTGPTGSGKSTTLASILDYANDSRCSHIITIEDPVEYVHQPKQCLISQREVGRDVGSFGAALRSALREDPDIILLGEMRDFETISAAITAAETGHLVFSTLHTTGAAKSVDRIIDVFPPHQQEQIRTQLAGVLQGIITQQLVRKIEGGRAAALEIMVATPNIANMIREGKTHQIDSAIQTGAKDGMILLDNSLGQMVRRGEIELQEALAHCVKPSELEIFAGRGRQA